MFPYACKDIMTPMRISTTYFFHCKTANDVWNAANVWHLISSSLSHFHNVPDIIFNLLQQLSTFQIEIINTIMWSISKDRNLKLWQQVSNLSVRILQRAKHLLKGWRNANRKQSPHTWFTQLPL